MVRSEQIFAPSDLEALEIAELRVSIYRREFREARGICRKGWYTLRTLRNEDTAALIFPPVG